MDVSTEKSTMMTNCTNSLNADITMNGQKLEEITSFKYLGATLGKDGTCSTEVRVRIASAMAAMARLNRIWHCNTINFNTQVQAVQFSCHLRSPLRLWNMDLACSL